MTDASFLRLLNAGLAADRDRWPLERAAILANQQRYQGPRVAPLGLTIDGTCEEVVDVPLLAPSA